jgi:3-hydroxyisobutyrate dehydrogenase-like beta-hydroxyacid dehydrogenase
MNIGFIGVGNMGRHMARHLQEGGYNLWIHDIRKEAAQFLIDKGAKWADSPATVARNCEIVLLSLPGPPQVEEVVFGQNGLASGWKRGDIVIDTSTNSPDTIRGIAVKARNAGVNVLDAPITGGVPGAEAAKLNFLVGGDAAVLEKVKPILLTMGKNIFHVGDSGCGDVAKLVNNMLALSCFEVDSEAFILGVKAGIDPATLLNVVKASTGSNSSVELYSMTVPKGNFDPIFRLSLAVKDIKLALDLGKKNGVPLPIGTAVAERLMAAEAAGLGEKGNQAIALLLEKANGVEVRIK